ncbi:hypothetical protein [Nitrosomonas sp. Nm166]|uniref:hypothetical protein n=1 Tax=Nitrosomonas sp. Nm166 TaxID=1881054 RepID=UPI001C42F711|nr:hypothetical protein [Nitrosomonas sp. Nm166]
MYPSDLSDEERALVAIILSARILEGKSRHTASILSLMQFSALTKLVPNGALPTDFPSWKTVYDHYWPWNQRNVWESALDEINELHRKKR